MRLVVGNLGVIDQDPQFGARLVLHDAQLLIWFTVWSSVVHGGIMAAQSLENPEHIGHLWGDVSALFLVAIVLGVLTPREATVQNIHAGRRG